MSTAKKQYVKIKGRLNYFMPNTESKWSTPERKKFELCLTNINEYTENEDALKMLDAMGTRIREEEKYADRGRFIVSSSQYPIKTLDARKNPVPEGMGIGNGSVAVAVFEVYPSKGDTNFGLGVRAVQILELVPYERKVTKEDMMKDLFEEEDGFEVPADAVTETLSSSEDSTSAGNALDDEIPF